MVVLILSSRRSFDFIITTLVWILFCILLLQLWPIGRFSPKDKNLVLQRPGTDIHSNMQIVWLNHIMATEHTVLSYALNRLEIGAGGAQTCGTSRYHRLYKDSKRNLKVNGLNWASNTVYKFDGCYWHGYPVPSGQTHTPTRIKRRRVTQ